MAIQIKTAEDIEKMRVAGQLAADVLNMIGEYVKPGITTNELNQICHDYIVNVQDAWPAPLEYGSPPFPKSICTSVNEQVCHGIPSDKRLKKGDAINIDITVIKNGYHGDTSKMFFAGQPQPHLARLADITRQCMYRGIQQVRPGARLGDIGHAIQTFAEKHNYSVVREFCGHGIGKFFHEEPQVLHYGKPGTGIELREGMIFTIEPMINQGKHHVKILADQWTAITKDRRPSAQWEHTVLVTADGFEILTLREEEAGWQDRL
ncbi:MAG: type I methionyl aminopeptidase [Thiothrix nivea]|nr:MAG: type I methionyl aminopeptidase [Thiothrix nivea]